jgi:hypothetical protein
MATPSLSRTIAAEARAVEEGHHAWADGRRFRIVSDTTDLRYLVSVAGMGDANVLFICDHPIVRGFSTRPHATNPGDATCKHAALVARRLEREGHLMWTDTGWKLTPATAAIVDAELAARRPADPFAGL